VSHAFEAVPRIPLTLMQGEPLLGMEHWIAADPTLAKLFGGSNANVDWVKAPNDATPGSPTASGARHHGDFDDDPATVRATLACILGPRGTDGRRGPTVRGERVELPRSASAPRRLRLVTTVSWPPATIPLI